MSQFFEYTGVVEEVLPVQTFSSGFTKREVIVGNDVDSPSKYPNPVKFTFKKDNCSLIDGIQKGHMKLHARNLATVAGATAEQLDVVVAKMIADKMVSVDHAKEILAGM